MPAKNRRAEKRKEKREGIGVGKDQEENL